MTNECFYGIVSSRFATRLLRPQSLPTKEDKMKRLEDDSYENNMDSLCELEVQNSEVLARLRDMVHKRKYGVNNFTKKKIKHHIKRYNFNDEWAKRGRELLKKAQTDRARRAAKNNTHSHHIDIDDNQDDDKEDSLVEFLEWRFMQQ